MAFYEYKLIPAATGKPATQAIPIDSLTEEINLRAMTGWEFVGTEVVSRQRRKWIILKESEELCCMVFRREVNARVGTPRTQMQTLRARAEEIAVRRPSRTDLVAAVRSGQRRIRVHAPAGAAPTPSDSVAAE
jgi:hypothetical protein